MGKIPDGSVDMVLADPPYGTTACKWDSIIPLEPMWEHLKRVTKKNGAIVMTASQPFTTTLIASNMEMFKYCWVYQKTKATNYLQAKKQAMKYHEDVCVFYSEQPTYNPQMVSGEPYTRKHGEHNNDVGGVYRRDTRKKGHLLENKGERYPSSVIPVIKNQSGRGQLHPTQKPVALMEYLIKTYTNENKMCDECDEDGLVNHPFPFQSGCAFMKCPTCNGTTLVQETVLDFAMGSGTTGVACRNLGRDFIGIEKDPEYFKIAENRITEVLC